MTHQQPPAIIVTGLPLRPMQTMDVEAEVDIIISGMIPAHGWPKAGEAEEQEAAAEARFQAKMRELGRWRSSKYSSTSK